MIVKLKQEVFIIVIFIVIVSLLANLSVCLDTVHSNLYLPAKLNLFVSLFKNAVFFRFSSYYTAFSCVIKISAFVFFRYLPGIVQNFFFLIETLISSNMDWKIVLRLISLNYFFFFKSKVWHHADLNILADCRQKTKTMYALIILRITISLVCL